MMIVPPGGAFRHREQIHLAYIAVQRYGPGKAADAVAHLTGAGGWGGVAGAAGRLG